MQNVSHDPEIAGFPHVEPIRLAIGTVIMFCVLWFLVVLLIYQIARNILLRI